MNMLASRSQLRASFLRWALFTVPACLLLGFVSGVVGGSPDSLWFEALAKPAIFPDPRWFGIVWSILYVMMGVALALVCAAWGARGRTAALVAFGVQFALNLAWSPIFFGFHRISIALIVIAALIAVLGVTIALFWKVRRLAALLLVPYLVWVCFASVLNYQFLALNPQADGTDTPTRAVQRIEL